MNKIKKVKNSTVKFVEKHKVGLAVAATVLVAVKVNKLALRDHENFMAEHGILDAFYTLTDEV